MKGYVYRFLGEGGEVIYVGHTINLNSRLKSHIGRKTYGERQIPYEDIHNIKKAEYVELSSRADMMVLEAYLIALWKPKYNKDFVEEDKLTFKLDHGNLDWRDYEMGIDDNPHHHIFVWKDDELLYEIPKVGMVYTCLCMKLGITLDMNFDYGHAFYSNGYKLMRLTEKRHIRTGKETQRPKYSFMGYPELFKEGVA